MEDFEARFVEESAVIETVVEFIRSGESGYINATYYLKKRLADLPAYIMPTLKDNGK